MKNKLHYALEALRDMEKIGFLQDLEIVPEEYI